MSGSFKGIRERGIRREGANFTRIRRNPFGGSFFSEAARSAAGKVARKTARSWLGKEGGEPYWSWYGFGSRVEWCACFVSWCADRCGYLESGVIPKFALCSDGAAWFFDRGQWQDRDYHPKAGDLIFFDWETDGRIDHVGIAERCEDGTVGTIEGNTGDACKRQSIRWGAIRSMGME